MITLRNWNDLTQFGIVPLTGEACKLSMRLLCDLTPRGQRIIREMFSLFDMRVEYTLPDAWNGSVVQLSGAQGRETANKSIMLPLDLWQTLAVFCLTDSPDNEEVYAAEGKPLIAISKEEVAQRQLDSEFAANLRGHIENLYGTTPYDPGDGQDPIPMLHCRVIRNPKVTGLPMRNMHQMSGRTL